VRRGDLFRVRRPGGDPRRARVVVVVGRQAVIDARVATVTCAPVLTPRGGLSTEVAVGPATGLKLEASVQCDALMSVPKASLTDYVGALPPEDLERLAAALRIALDLE
jgi:mRNA-degrading endonuclease toxin of MazEF toxin-antitoxin module